MALRELLGVLVPPRCAVCSRPCSARLTLCERCESLLRRRRPRFAVIPGTDAAWAACVYGGIARELVVALKFAGRLRLATRAAEAIAEDAPAPLLEGVIVPVPAAPLRRRWRGFDPADAIATSLSSRTGIGLARCLGRLQGERQVGRPRGERLSQPPVVHVRHPPPPRAILVDDVMTTGATLGACARALRQRGSVRVVALTFARAGEEAGRPGELA